MIRPVILAAAFCLMCGNLLSAQKKSPRDWLIEPDQFTAQFLQDHRQEDRFVLTNGIAARQFLLSKPVGATIGLECRFSEENLFRAVQPEAIVTVNGIRYPVGGLTGQPNHAYLRDEWLSGMQPAANALQLVGHRVGQPTERFAWKRTRHHAPDVKWPPPGIHLTLEFAPPENSHEHPDFRVQVHYELYDGVPVFCKWITVENRSDTTLLIDHFASELLSVVEHDSRVETRAGVALPRPRSLHVETDFAFGGFTSENANRHVVHWRPDPDYATQVNYKRETPCLLVVEPTYGPAQSINPGESFHSCRAFELIYDSTDRERRSLSLRKMYRTIAPWVTENPLMHHMRNSDPQQVRRAIDDAAAVGFEMVILSFGSGFDIEDESADAIQQWTSIAEYARQRSVEIGGYSLLSSRQATEGDNIVSPDGQTPTHGKCPALTSRWGQDYYRKLYQFFEKTGFTLLEHDGPYPGDVDVTPRPPLQKGEQDSRWVQGQIANEFYRWCRGKGIYLNAPDYYYLSGSNKCGMGYREVNWSLPREMQLIHTRQNIFDGTWYKTPSMGWMFVPLSEYHGGGAAATIEPLDQHLQHYDLMMKSNLAAGVQACFRGPRLFDTDRTREMVQRNVEWFKQYRDILESDLIHGRRADGRDLDWWIHVNPQLDHKAMLLVFNPGEQPVRRTIPVNLYYSGLSTKARITDQSNASRIVELQRDYRIDMEVQVPAQGMAWYVFEDDPRADASLSR